jgi:hypothetical protein
VGTRGDTVGAAPGYVFGYGRTSDLPFTGTQPVTFPATGISGESSVASVTLTATEDLTVNRTSLTATGAAQPFTEGTPEVDGTPVPSLSGTHLAAGQVLTIPLAFDPAAAGGFAGQLRLNVTDAAGSKTVAVELSGTGTEPGLAAIPATLHFGANGRGDNDTNFGPVPIGSSEPIQTAITNTSTTSVTVTSITLARSNGPFTVSAPALPFTLAPGQSQILTVTYTPTVVSTARNPITETMTITNSSPSKTTTVRLEGVSKRGAGVLTPSPTSVRFGPVPLGTTGSAALTFTNTGNLPVTVIRFTAPGVPFGMPGQTVRGMSIAPGDKVSVPVTYTPQGGGTSTGSYRITTTDGRNPARTLTIGVSGTAAPAPRSCGSGCRGWVSRGRRRLAG